MHSQTPCSMEGLLKLDMRQGHGKYARSHHNSLASFPMEAMTTLTKLESLYRSYNLNRNTYLMYPRLRQELMLRPVVDTLHRLQPRCEVLCSQGHEGSS